jgi:pimeloyl-ACP methyl ester carboxylesterase
MNDPIQPPSEHPSTPIPIQRLTIPAAGNEPGTLSALNFGPIEGPIDVVFLHATGFNALTYRQLLLRLGPNRRCVAIDLRGHGHTTLAARPQRLTHWYGYARDVVDAIAYLRGNNPAPRLIAGHSMGATSALLALGRDPGAAQALLMIDPALVTPGLRRIMLLPFAPAWMRRRIPIARSAARRRAVFDDLEQILQNYRGRGAFRTWQAGFLEDYVEGAFTQRPDGRFALRCTPAWEAATFSAHRHDTAAALRALKVPARMMVAEQGSISMRSPALFSDNAPSMQIEVVPRSTHFIPMEYPDLVIDRMLSLAAG